MVPRGTFWTEWGRRMNKREGMTILHGGGSPHPALGQEEASYAAIVARGTVRPIGAPERP